MGFFIIFLLSPLMTFSQSLKRNYSEEEFLKKVNEEVLLRVEKIKNTSVSELTKEILEKEEKLRTRELDLVKQQDAIKISEQDLVKRYNDLAEKQKKIIGCIEKNNDESKKRISQLVEMITNMKPEKASSVLSVQDSEIAVEILQGIDPKKASKIFNFMDKEISAKLQKQYFLLRK